VAINLGYACINATLRESKNPIYTGRSCIKRIFEAKGLEHVSSLILKNVQDLLPILVWNTKFKISLFRISSNICPWASEYKLHDLPDFESIKIALETAGKFALENGIRLSFHPGQFNVLASPHENVVSNTIKDLELHGELMDLLLQPRSPAAKINIHVGGAYGDKLTALDRFSKNFEQLSPAVSSRLSVENDDKKNGYAVNDLMLLNSRLNVPIVFDYHHHKFCSGGLSESDALALAVQTWLRLGVKPMTHYSESRSKQKLHPAHSDWIDGPIHTYGHDIDCMLECKQKERALLLFRLRNKL
jgi:UV DNA damage endonuclease